MGELDFVGELHRSSRRDYLARVMEADKAECATVAKRFGREYWDGERHFGYGGYKYDGRWLPVAQAMAKHYGLEAGNRVLDVGCGKGYLLYEFTQAVPGIEVAGLDVSTYAIENAKPEIRPFLLPGSAAKLPYPDDSFDLVVSLGALHNLYVYDVFSALKEIERVGRSAKYVMVESYRDEREKVNLLYWQQTCETFFTPVEWQWFRDLAGYSGDHGFIYFE